MNRVFLSFRNSIYFPGIFLCLVIALVAKILSMQFSFSAVVFAVLLGFIIKNTTRLSTSFSSGIKISEKYFLQIAIVLMGLQLDFSVLQRLGFQTMVIILLGMTFTIFTAKFFGKIFKIKSKLALLIGVGNAVCGNSAIAATKEIIDADEEDVGLSIAVINVLGSLSIFLIPILAVKILHFPELSSGILIGNTLQAVAHVVAASHAVGDIALQTATIVKMVRVLMLTPLVLILVFLNSKKGKRSATEGKVRIPFFIVGFVLLALVPTFGLLSESVIKIFLVIGHYLLVIAMAAIGLNISFVSIIKGGKAAFLTGIITFTLQVAFSLLMIHLFF